MNEQTNAVAKDYIGFTTQEFNQVEITGGYVNVDIYYNRNEYSVVLNFGEELISATGDGTYLYGETVKISAELQDDYEWIQWLSADESILANSADMNFSFAMPAGDVVLTADADYVDYAYLSVKTLALEREMTMVFYVDADALAGKENISLEVKKPIYADGNGEVVREEVDVVTEYTSANVLGKNMYRFVYGNLNAKEYGIEVTATLIADGRVKDVDTFSVREYAYGQLSKTTNAKCYCEIDAVGYANTGMIMGIPRADATLASNCQLGGKIATTNGEDGKPFFRTLVDAVDSSNGTENADGSVIVLLPEYVMYYDVIYGGTTEWAEGATYDTCTLLTQKP